MSFGREKTEQGRPMARSPLPFGAMGVAAIMAAFAGMVGLLLPASLLESMAFQMYLDTVIAAAVPPFGWLAKLVAALLFALVGGLAGFILARLFGADQGGLNLRQLLDRLRGVGAEDDADAPALRAADRHPDAPARRPFSTVTDMPARQWDQHWDDGTSEEDDGELLLDSQFADQESASPCEPGLAPPSIGLAPGLYVEESLDEDIFVPAESAPVAPSPAAPVARDAAISATPAAQPIAVPAPAPSFTPNPTPEPAAPLDLSTGKLDALLARLEAGLTHRRGVHAPALTDSANIDQSANAAIPEQAIAPSTPPAETLENPAFPQDPALAAALSTLRRMNQHVG